MNPRKLILITLILGTIVTVSTLVLGCQSKSTVATGTPQIVDVQRGDLKLDITAVGNLAYSQQEELSFDTGGTIAEIPVEVGDSVKKGQVLAKLNTSEWQDKITTLENQLTQKQQTLTLAEQKVATAERNVTTKQRAVTTKEQAVTKAERDLETARYNLTLKERAVVQKQLDMQSAEIGLRQAQYTYDTNTTNPKEWDYDNLMLKKKQLELTKAGLTDVLRAVDTAKNDIADAEIATQNAKTAVADAKLDVQDAEQAVTNAKADVETAKKAVADAQKSLAEAKATSPEIVAPFDGLITVINTPAGETVAKGRDVVTIVDPNKFKAEVMVGETDISSVKVNGEATVELDAISGISLPAKIISISPTATTSQGVVSYKVRVDIESPSAQQQNTGQTPAQSGQSGQITRQLPPGVTPGQGQTNTTQRQGQTRLQVGAAPQSVQLRQGLTVSVSLVIQERKGVIMVPNQAITRSGANTTVNVTKNGATSTRTIKTGIANSRYTEVTEGLTEGEQVVYTRTTTSTTSTSTQTQKPGGFMIPGMGGPR